MMKKYLFLIYMIAKSFNSEAQDDDGSFSGFYAGPNYSFAHSDLFSSTGALGFQLGFTQGFYLHEKGDLVVNIGVVNNSVSLDGTYNTQSEHHGESISTRFNIISGGLDVYYYHYFIVNDNGNGFYANVLGGFQFLGGNNWEVANEDGDPYDVYYGNPYINFEALENQSEFNVSYSFGVMVGTSKFKAILQYNHSLTNLFRNKEIYKVYDEYNMPVEEEGFVSGNIKLSAITLNLVYEL